MFYDTGATLSLVAARVIANLDMMDKILPSSINITGLGKSIVPMLGEIDLEIEFAGTKLLHRFCVREGLEHSFLIGMDVINAVHADIDILNKRIHTPHGSSRFIQEPVTLRSVRKIRCQKTVHLQPNTMNYVKGQLDMKNSNNAYYEGVIMPFSKLADNKGIFVTRSMCYSDGNKVPVQCMNITDEIVTIYKGQMLGFLEPVQQFEKLRNVRPVKPNSNIFRSNICHTASINRIDNDAYDASINIPRFIDNEQDRIRNEKWDDISQLYQILKIDDMQLSSDMKHALRKLIARFSHCFSRHDYDLGKCTFYKARINLKRDYEPVWIPSIPVPYKHREHMQEQIDERIKNDQITSCPYSLWNSIIFLTSKKNGSKRLVTDARNINVMSLPDNFQLPRIANILDTMGNCKLFSSFDFTSSFNSIELDEESQPITAFTFRGNHYMWKRMIMGHVNSSSQFSRMMAQLFSKIPFPNLICYVDDLLVASPDDPIEHLKRLEFVFKRLSWSGLKLNPRKTSICAKSVSFVGHKLSGDGVSIDPNKVKAIVELDPPKTVKQLQSFLGAVNYLRSFIKGFATIAKPLYDLLRKGKIFDWNELCQNSFEKLKQALISSPVLALPEVDDPLNSYQLAIDASKLGFGAVLSQIVNGERRIISFYSKAVPKQQQNYGATKLEFLALWNALMHYRIYLHGANNVTVITDCKPLLHLTSIFSKGNAYIQRRLADLAGFNLTIKHVSGESNVLPDFLSRYPFEKPSKNKSSQTPESSFKPSQCEMSVQTRNEDEPAQVCSINIPESDIDRTKPITMAELRTETIKDSILSDVINWFENGKPDRMPGLDAPEELKHYYRKFELLSLENEILYYKLIKKDNPDQCNRVIVVPYSLIEKVLYTYHDSMQNLHSGVEQSYNASREKYYFYKQKEEFKLYIAACLTCNRINQPTAYLKVPLKPVVYYEFNDCISLDHLEVSKTPTPRRNTALLVIIDKATNYTVCVPVKSQGTDCTIKAIIEHWVCRFGVPRVVQTDNGAGFSSKLFEAIMESFNIKHTRSVPYHKQGNGAAEAAIKRINHALRATLTPEQYKDWDIWCKYVMLSLNSLKSHRTGYSANFLVFGRKLNMPRDWWIEENDLQKQCLTDMIPEDMEKMQAYHLYRRVRNLTREVQRNTRKRAEYTAKQYNKNLHEPNFNVGDYIMLLINVKEHKLGPAWRGPYKIIKKINDYNYIVEIDKVKGVTRLTSVTKMQPYASSDNKYANKITNLIERQKPEVKKPLVPASRKKTRQRPDELEDENDLGTGWFWDDTPDFELRIQPSRRGKRTRSDVETPTEIVDVHDDTIQNPSPTESVVDTDDEISVHLEPDDTAEFGSPDAATRRQYDSGGDDTFHTPGRTPVPSSSRVQDTTTRTEATVGVEPTPRPINPSRSTTSGESSRSTPVRRSTREKKQPEFFGSPIPWNLVPRFKKSDDKKKRD